MVRTGSEELNHPKLMKNCPMNLVPSKAQWFEQVRKNRFREKLNQPELMRNYPVTLVPSRAQWFEQVRKSWTTPSSCQGQPRAWFPVLNYGSNRFGKVEPPWTHEKLSYDPCSLCMALRGSTRFGRVEPHRSHVKFHHRPGFLCWTMVQTGSEELNLPELMRNYPMILVPSGAQRFDKVR